MKKRNYHRSYTRVTYPFICRSTIAHPSESGRRASSQSFFLLVGLPVIWREVEVNSSTSPVGRSVALATLTRAPLSCACDLGITRQVCSLFRRCRAWEEPHISRIELLSKTFKEASFLCWKTIQYTATCTRPISRDVYSQPLFSFSRIIYFFFPLISFCCSFSLSKRALPPVGE